MYLFNPQDYLFGDAMKKIMLLGASGSIGRSSIDILLKYPEQFLLIGVSVYQQTDYLETIISLFPSLKMACVKDEKTALIFKEKYPYIQFFYGEEGLQVLAKSEYDILINALVGFVGLIPTYTAICSNHDIALANKETLVAGGQLIMEAAKKHHVHIYPVDSEHSAIFQCLESENPLHKILITASGGPFFQYTKDELKNVTLQQALRHPNWVMGKKITIDSATMFNKAFEVIEAFYLFHLKPEQIEVLIHPQSMIHSMVEFQDGSIKAQIAVPDMKLPIAYALSYPQRLPAISAFVDWKRIHQFEFYSADEERFPSLKMARQVLEEQNVSGAILNAANEIAVQAFLEGKIAFYQIDEIVAKTFAQRFATSILTLEAILQADKWAREYTRRLCDAII